MDDNLISQLLDTQGDADFGDSDLIKMRKVSVYSAWHRFPQLRNSRCMLPSITQYRSISQLRAKTEAPEQDSFT